MIPLDLLGEDSADHPIINLAFFKKYQMPSRSILSYLLKHLCGPLRRETRISTGSKRVYKKFKGPFSYVILIIWQNSSANRHPRVESLHGYSDIFTEKTYTETNINYHIGLTVHRSQSVPNSQYCSGIHIRRPETMMVSQRSEFATPPLQHGESKGYPFSPFELEQGCTPTRLF